MKKYIHSPPSPGSNHHILVLRLPFSFTFVPSSASLLSNFIAELGIFFLSHGSHMLRARGNHEFRIPVAALRLHKHVSQYHAQKTNTPQEKGQLPVVKKYFI